MCAKALGSCAEDATVAGSLAHVLFAVCTEDGTAALDLLKTAPQALQGLVLALCLR